MSRPNVIVFFTDQQRHDTSGLHGCPLDLMPNFDRLARQHTHIANSFTCQPVCGPARACLQTGRYQTQTGCYRNAIALPDDEKGLGEYFKEAGYQTGYIGKWHLHTHGEQFVPAEKRHGYDFWLGANALEHTSEAYDFCVFDNDGEKRRFPGYRVDAQTDCAIRYVTEAQAKDDPFFLFLSYIEPHHQNRVDDYPPPDGWRERFAGTWMPEDLRALGGSAPAHWVGYCGMVKRLDEAFGRLMDSLKSLGIADNTIVLFTSDHACHFKTRNGEYKRSCHDSSLRVPTAFFGPGFEAGGQRPELISLIDLPPTLLDAAGLEVPEVMQGHSLMPRLRGEKTPWPEEVFVQISESHTGRAIRTNRWKYSVRAPGKEDEHWKDVGPTSDTYVEEFLYDLEADPHELTNLIESEAFRPVREKLRARLLTRMEEVGEPVPEIAVAEERRSGQRYPLEAEMP